MIGPHVEAITWVGLKEGRTTCLAPMWRAPEVVTFRPKIWYMGSTPGKMAVSKIYSLNRQLLLLIRSVRSNHSFYMIFNSPSQVKT